MNREELPQVVLDTSEYKNKNQYPPSGLYIAIALLIIFFGGEPDIVDAIIHFLMR